MRLAREALIASTPSLQARDQAKRAALEQLLAQHLARQIRVSADTDVRPLLWAKIGMACFFAGYHVWLHAGGDLAGHITAARTTLSATLTTSEINEGR